MTTAKIAPNAAPIESSASDCLLNFIRLRENSPFINLRVPMRTFLTSFRTGLDALFTAKFELGSTGTAHSVLFSDSLLFADSLTQEISAEDVSPHATTRIIQQESHQDCHYPQHNSGSLRGPGRVVRKRGCSMGSNFVPVMQAGHMMKTNPVNPTRTPILACRELVVPVGRLRQIDRNWPMSAQRCPLSVKHLQYAKTRIEIQA